jgi:YidC/Oxa1 family membrane protein insertase
VGFFEIFAAALAGFYALIPSLGLAIILLTVVVRLLLLPLSIKQTRSMREMQLIQPEVKKLQAKFKGDRQKMNEAVMALYKEHHVNPFGGCLPLVMQFPVLIGLFYVIRAPLKYMGYTASGEPIPNVSGILATVQGSALADALRNMALEVHKFLGIRLDCSASAAISGADPSSVGEVCGSGLVSAIPYLFLVLLMGFTTYYQQRQMQAQRGPAGADNPQAQQMQMFTKILPVMLMFFSFSFPTGVVLYWLTTNVWQIGQQRLMLRAAPPLPPAKGAAPKPPPGDGEGGLLGRLRKARNAPPSRAVEEDGDGQVRPKPSKPHPSSKKKKKR